MNSSFRILTIIGICKVSGSKDGTFGNATFNVPVAVCFNEDRNLLVVNLILIWLTSISTITN
jgi:hypothetical protein